jgi:aarF domain-containing kinase
MQKAFGKNWQEKIELQEVLGSGCIGQVYRGVVQSNGSKQKVAVKVLHPNVDDDIDADLDIMRLAVSLIDWAPFWNNLKWLNLSGVVEEFADLLKQQLDLRQEAANLERFNANFKDVSYGVVFPKLIKEYKPTKDILIESYCDGMPVVDYARSHSDERDKLHRLCLTAIKAVCKMIFLDNCKCLLLGGVNADHH